MNQITWNQSCFFINSKKISSNYNTLICFTNEVNNGSYNGHLFIIQDGMYYDFFVDDKRINKDITGDLDYLNNLIFTSTDSHPKEILVHLFGFDYYQLYGSSEFNSLEIDGNYIKIQPYLTIKKIKNFTDIKSICYLKPFQNPFQEIKFY